MLMLPVANRIIYLRSDASRAQRGRKHSLAVKTDGTVWAFGENQYGQLGSGNNTDSNVPLQVAGLCEGSGVNDITMRLSISAFPSPFENELIINANELNGEVIVYNVLRKEMFQQKTFSKEIKINTEKLTPGIYLLKYEADNRSANVKVVKF